MSQSRKGFSESEREVVKTLLETKAVDFAAIGQTVARLGEHATLHLSGEDVFCGTMRNFVRVYRIPHANVQVEDLGALAEVAAQVKGS